MKHPSSPENQEIRRMSRLFTRQSADELRLMPGRQTNERLWESNKKLPTDYDPWGSTDRTNGADCSSGCAWYHELAGRAAADWGICTNPASPRTGLLTFEHQGCPHFEEDRRWDYLYTANGKKARQKFEDREEELRQWKKANPIRTVRVAKSK